MITTGYARFLALESKISPWHNKWLEASRLVAPQIFGYDNEAFCRPAKSDLGYRLTRGLAHDIAETVLINRPFKIALNASDGLDEEQQAVLQRQISIIQEQAQQILADSALDKDFIQAVIQLLVVGHSVVHLDSKGPALNVLTVGDVVWHFNPANELVEIVRRIPQDDERNEYKYHWGIKSGNSWHYTLWSRDGQTWTVEGEDHFGLEKNPYNIIHVNRLAGATVGSSLVIDNTQLLKRHLELEKAYDAAVMASTKTIFFEGGSGIDLQRLANSKSGEVLAGNPNALIPWSPSDADPKAIERLQVRLEALESELGRVFVDLQSAIPSPGSTTLGELLERKAVLIRSLSGIYTSIRNGLLKPIVKVLITILDDSIAPVREHVNITPTSASDSEKVGHNLDLLINRLLQIGQLPEGIDKQLMMLSAIKLTDLPTSILSKKGQINQSNV